jgi:hypothetical protein
VSQQWIQRDDQPGLLTRIAAMRGKIVPFDFRFGGSLSFYWHHGASRLQPAVTVGPYALLMKTLLFRYQTAVLRVVGL